MLGFCQFYLAIRLDSFAVTGFRLYKKKRASLKKSGKLLRSLQAGEGYGLVNYSGSS
jgi:hypothetical protein